MTTTTTIPLESIIAFLNSMSLNAPKKRWLGEHLIAEAMKEESMTIHAPQTRRIVKRRSANSPSDAELEARFAGLETPEIPADPEWSEVISANTGKTIKPIEKWL